MYVHIHVSVLVSGAYRTHVDMRAFTFMCVPSV